MSLAQPTSPPCLTTKEIILAFPIKAREKNIMKSSSAESSREKSHTCGGYVRRVAAGEGRKSQEKNHVVSLPVARKCAPH